MEKILNGTASVLPKTAAEFRDLITRDEKPGDGKKLNARERLTALFDDGTFTEIGAFTVRRRDSEEAPASDPEGVLTGYGSVDGCLVYAFAQDLQRTKGAVSDATADKIERLYRLAVGNGCPVVGCFDSAGADLVSGVRALAAYGRIMKAVGAASGIVPQIAVVNGIAQGASAVIAAMFDFVIVTEDSTLSVNPAFVVGGGKAADSVEAGVASFREKTDADALKRARDLLGLLPSNNEEGTVERETGDDPDRQTDLSAYKASHAAADLLREIGDAGSFLSVGADTAPSVLTGFLTLDGTVCGVIATDRSVNGGKLTSLAARKAAKFLSFCDCFSIPVLTAVDSEGFSISGEEEKNPYCSEIAKLAGAYASAKIPLVTLVSGAAYGSVFSVLGSKSIGADLVLALDSAKIGCMSPASAVALLENDKVSGKVSRESLETEWETEKLNVLHAARAGEIDDIVEEAELRQRLISAVLMLSGKASAAPKRRHANMPL
ncbi:MAG: hypothetical protein II680_04625 [Clostridia bacterium]|nr:hypothetical protein [Clostridia bacterium]